MSGIYFHIPFCKRVCRYCDFYHSVCTAKMGEVMEAMHQELDEEHGFLSDRRVRTIYFGGGTPSLVPPEQIQSFISQVKGLYDCSSLEEITIEVNPDDVGAQYVTALRGTDVNRVSIGVQSLDDAELRFMGRRHDSRSALDAVKRLQDAGFDNISVDLIYGVSGFDEEVLSKTLDGFIGMGIQHVSAYHLSIEPGTAFALKQNRGEFSAVSDEQSEREYRLVCRRLQDAGFDHYEISNFALPARYSRHNSAYWTSKQYLGIGPGAHSYSGSVRRWCVQKLDDYLLRREYQRETLGEEDRINEYVMTALRTSQGIDLEEFEKLFGAAHKQRLLNSAQPFCAARQMQFSASAGRLSITEQAWLVSDGIMAEMFV